MDVLGTFCARMVFHSLDGCCRIVNRWLQKLACCTPPPSQQEEEEEFATKSQAIDNPINAV